MNQIGHTKIVDDTNYEEYDKLDIDKFGKEMLYKMGWKENQPVKSGGPIKSYEIKCRAPRSGLGAEQLEDVNKKSSRPEKYMDKKLNFYGTKIKITSGKHKELKGKIVEKGIEDLDKFLRENKYVTIELKINRQIVKVESNFIKLRRKENKERKEKTEKSISKSKSRSRSRKKENIIKNSNKSSENQKSPTYKNRILKWVIPNIEVRIISKKSKYYNTKAIIVDLNDLYTFSILTSDKTLHTNFSEKDIETVIPKINEDIIILADFHKGEYAKLIERDKKKNTVTVQLLSDFSIERYTQDEVCSFSKN